MQNSSYKYYKELPPWAKGVAVVGILAVGYLFANQVIKKIKEEQEKKKNEKKLADAKNELQVIIDSGQLATKPKSEFNSMADVLVEQFSGCDFSISAPWVYEYNDLSDSGKVVYDTVSNLNNNRDFLELVDSFGVRSWDDCGYGTGDLTNKNLYEGISNEINNAEIKFINNYLKNRGITYTF